MDEASKYNEWLFAPKVSEKEAADEMYALLRKRKLTAAMSKALDKELEEKEVRAAIRGMALGKSPGPDKLGAEFYKEFEDLVAGDLLSMLKEAIEVGYFHEDTRTGEIILLYKKNDPREIRNYRPIMEAIYSAPGENRARR